MKIVIVGGVAGGASAAARARRLDETAEIVVLERGPDVSFANCGMPYYAGGVIKSRQALIVTTPEHLRKQFALDVRTRSEVLAIDPAARCVRVRDLETGREYDEAYDRLLLAPGATPLKPPIPGIDLPGIHTLRNLQDMDRIKAALDGGATRAVVVGAGFIGLELAENLVHRGVATTIVELQDQVLPPLDREMTAAILETLTRNKVETILADSAAAFEQTATHLEVVLTSGRRLPADVVLLGIGVRPESGLAAAAGLAVGPRGGIQVNAGMQTSDPAIWAVGDAVEIPDGVFGTPTQIPLAGPANRQGRLAADGMCGRSGHYRGSQGTSVVGVFKATAACTGCSEKLLQRAGRDYRKVYVHPASHAGYYPGAEPMSLKLLFDPADGRVLGAQGVGGAGVDKRIDVLAVAIQARMTVYDLEEMELCYAPQFGSAKDPVNMAGFVAAGLLRGDHPQESWDAVISPDPTTAAPLLLDVRTEDEFLCGEVPGAVNIPLDELRSRLGELPRDRQILCYCQVGQRGYYATRILLQHGFNAANLGGGFKTYKMLMATAP